VLIWGFMVMEVKINSKKLIIISVIFILLNLVLSIIVAYSIYNILIKDSRETLVEYNKSFKDLYEKIKATNLNLEDIYSKLYMNLEEIDDLELFISERLEEIKENSSDLSELIELLIISYEKKEDNINKIKGIWEQYKEDTD